MLNVITDRKIPASTPGIYTADVVSYSDYSPYGVQLDGRHGDESGRAIIYGFQGQEMDDEIKGEGNSLNYEYRMHDPRIGRFFTIDPLFRKYPYWSPYAFSGNQVTVAAELEGLEVEENLNENESKATQQLQSIDINPYVQGISGDGLGGTRSNAISWSFDSELQAKNFAESTGGHFKHTPFRRDIEYKVYIPRNTELGKEIVSKLLSEHGIKFKDLTRREKIKLLSVEWKVDGFLSVEDRSDLFYYRRSYEVLIQIGTMPIALPTTMPIAISPSAGTKIEAGTLFVNIDALAKTIVNDFSKVARGNHKQGDFEGWSDEEVNAEYQRLSKGKLTKEEKKQKGKLSKEQKVRTMRNKQKKGSEKGVGSGN